MGKIDELIASLSDGFYREADCHYRIAGETVTVLWPECGHLGASAYKMGVDTLKMSLRSRLDVSQIGFTKSTEEDYEKAFELVIKELRK
jgi:hypothetical protein